MSLSTSPVSSKSSSRRTSKDAGPARRSGGYVNPDPRGPADTMALSDKRGVFQVFAWGQGLRHGEFGRKAIQWVPRPVSEFDATNEEPTGVVASSHRVMVWTHTGQTYLWQQGAGRAPPPAGAEGVSGGWQPGSVIMKPGSNQEQLFVVNGLALNTHAMALCREPIRPGRTQNLNKTLYAWGLNHSGVLGFGEKPKQDRPRLVPGLPEDVTAVWGGPEHTIAIAEDTLWSWGNGENGRLGHGNEKNMTVPKQVAYMARIKVTNAACGTCHTAAVSTTGEVFTWGKGANGRLGHGGVSRDPMEVTPRLVEALDSAGIVRVACGDAHTVVINGLDAVWSWGWNAYGQLGVGDESDRWFPSAVRPKEGWSGNVVHVSCGKYHTVATAGADVFTFGCGQLGQLGHGSSKSLTLPKKVEGLSNTTVAKTVTYTAAGDDFTMALVRTTPRAANTIHKFDPEGLKNKCTESFDSTKYEEMTEIELVRLLRETETQIQTSTEITRRLNTQIDGLKEKVHQNQVDYVEWQNMIKVLDVNLEVKREREAARRRGENEVEQEAQMALERRIAELKIVLGRQEEALMNDEMHLRDRIGALQKKENNNADRMLAGEDGTDEFGEESIEDFDTLQNKLQQARDELAAEENSKQMLLDAAEALKYETKQALDDKVALLREEAEASLSEIKASLEGGNSEEYDDIRAKELGLEKQMKEREAEIAESDSRSRQHDLKMPRLQEEFEAAKAAGETAVLEWEEMRLMQLDVKSQLQAKKTQLEVARTETTKVRARLQATEERIRQDTEDGKAEAITKKERNDAMIKRMQDNREIKAKGYVAKEKANETIAQEDGGEGREQD